MLEPSKLYEPILRPRFVAAHNHSDLSTFSFHGNICGHSPL